MEKAKVTTKGQITIPKQIRETLGLQAGDYVVFLEDDAGTITLSKGRMAPVSPIPEKAP